MPPPRERNLEWFRPDPRSLSGWWALGGALIFLGFMASGLGHWRLALGEVGPGILALGAGLGLVLLGLWLPLSRALRALAREEWVALQVEGLVVLTPPAPPRVVPWARVDAVRADAPGRRVVIETDDGALGTVVIPTERLAVPPAELAARISARRREALLGILR